MTVAKFYKQRQEGEINSKLNNFCLQQELPPLSQCPILLFLGCANGLPRLLRLTSASLRDATRTLGTSRSVQVRSAQVGTSRGS
ncbi:MAG: hypothetical protein V7L20_16025 [Nostoc sp.]|uniref:hypothetical protein n=1 Tax=Nostoc sp. TaxID=1180 RepID=UPI002FF7F945